MEPDPTTSRFERSGNGLRSAAQSEAIAAIDPSDITAQDDSPTTSTPAPQTEVRAVLQNADFLKPQLCIHDSPNILRYRNGILRIAER